MPVTLTIKVDTRAISRQLNDLARKQIPFAMATALNRTAKAAAAEANRAMPSVFERASPFTRAAVGTPQLATKTSLTATVAIKPLQAKYLGFEIEGGTRTPADNTRSQSRALVLPGKSAAPLPRGAVQRIAQQALADQARRQAVQAGMRKARRGAGNAGVFRMSGHSPWGGVGGFFRRLPGHHLSRLVAFEAQAHYQPKYRFREQVLSSVAGNWPRAFEEQLARALATAR